MSAAIRTLIAKRASGMTRQEIEEEIESAADEIMKLSESGGQRIAKSVAIARVHDEHRQLYNLWLAAPEAPPAPTPVIKADDRRAQDIVWARIDRCVDALLKADPGARFLPTHEHEVKRTALYSEYVCKNPGGRALYSLAEHVGNLTLGQLQEAAPRLAEAVKKCL